MYIYCRFIDREVRERERSAYTHSGPSAYTLNPHGRKPSYCSLMHLIKKHLPTNKLGHQTEPNRTSIKANHRE